MQKTGFFTKIYLAVFLFKVSAWLFNHEVCKIGLKVHKRENFLGSDIEICTFSLLVMHKC
jgi:hypothetical protein